MWIFSTLMQFRSAIASPQSVAALNSIDVVFIDHREVREAWRHFLGAANEKPFVADKLVERHRSLLEKMARALDLSGSISVGDIEASYYPEFLGTLDAASHMEAAQKVANFQQASQAVGRKPGK